MKNIKTFMDLLTPRVTVSWIGSMKFQKKKYKDETATPNRPSFWFWFFENIEKKENGCWVWKGTRTSAGYGVVSIQNERHYAHRLMYENEIENIPEDMEICHRCDTPTCVNPFHLFMGTHKENIQDAANKGRMGPKPKLTEKNVIQIKRLLAAGKNQYRIAESFNVSRSAILNIKHGKCWAWVKLPEERNN